MKQFCQAANTVKDTNNERCFFTKKNNGMEDEREIYTGYITNDKGMSEFRAETECELCEI